MNDDTRLPEDDRDLELARRLGDGRGGGPQDAEFVDALRRFKQHAQPSPDDEASNRMWSRIDEATRRGADRVPALRLVRSRRWVWAAAAAIAFAGVIALLTLQDPDAELIAEADKDVVVFTTGDGSEVTLRPHSRLYRIERSTYRIEGEAFFDVTPGEERVFAVEAGSGRIEVLGTEFDVATWGGETSVYLAEGRIRFSSDGEAVVLEPGERSAITADGNLVPPRAEPAGEHLDWLDGEIQFRERSVRRIADELEQHFGVRLDIPQDVQEETLTGRILLDDARRSLDELGQVMGGRFVESGPDSYRFTTQ